MYVCIEKYCIGRNEIRKARYIESTKTVDQACSSDGLVSSWRQALEGFRYDNTKIQCSEAAREKVVFTFYQGSQQLRRQARLDLGCLDDLSNKVKVPRKTRTWFLCELYHMLIRKQKVCEHEKLDVEE